MSYNNNGNNNDNRKGKGKGKKNKRKRNQLTPIKNVFKKSQSEYSPNSPPKHGTKARCINKQGKKVKEFIKKGKQAQSFIFGDYAFAGYSDDNINGDNDNIDGDNDNTNERLDLNSKWGDRSDARSMKLLLDIQNEVDVKADTTTEEEEEEEDFDMIGAGVFNHRGVERRSGRGGGITVQSRGRARGRNNSESKPTLKSKSKSKSNLRSKSRSKSRAPRSKSRSRISGISVERKRSKSKARSRSRSRSRLVSGAQANQAVLDELDDQQAPINVRQVLPGNFDNPDPRLEEELLPLSDESDSANDGDGDNINDAGSQSQSQSQSQSNSRNLFERAEPVGYTEENKDTFDWDTAEAEGYERDEEKMKELRTWLRQNKGWTGSCCATRWLSQYVWLYFKYDHDNPRMLCIICFRYLGKEGLLFLVTSMCCICCICCVWCCVCERKRFWNS